MNPEQLRAHAGRMAAIERVCKAGVRLAEAVEREMLLEARRGIETEAAIKRLIGTPNALTGKEHSASSAEKIKETDAGYKLYDAGRIDSIADRHRAWAEYDAAKLEAQLAVAMATTENATEPRYVAIPHAKAL